ncbi:MAG TPA: hypothetical protein VNW15_16765 [Rhizomicrobium sp.]|nr:hypothetical protein [Rhizomicrobium sp.]
MIRKQTLAAGALLALALGPALAIRAFAADAGEPVPVFQVDPAWPQLPQWLGDQQRRQDRRGQP